ncbi:30S ribosomal protein S1 [Aerococcus christensenii]|uniref:30S ribosomal protein S1 n=1 Tax=Aerococcus christensenii TaxID=87541 RepID=A0A2I1K9A0_9LACT|nr:30S ribosomal protein S1 [Aerococcus christensenii]PKY92220.1 30S ribosomal protein S1 [Aerococcus christensenii]WEB70633.1 30S ribosomal protein S1 [Aerococcus christensenii]
MTNEFENQASEVEETMPSMEDMLAETKEVKIGDTVTGEVLAIDENNQLVVGIEGAGVEGVVPFRELTSKQVEDVTEVANVGDKLELVVVKQIKDKENGTFLLSHRRLEAQKVWKELEEKAANKEVLTVPVTKVVKGGLVVDAGVRGFIPASMVENYFVRDFSAYKGKELDARIVEINPVENRLILSHKEIAAEQEEKARTEKLEQFEEGEVVEGTVARLANFGAFIDLGDIDGLVHISQIAHHHVNHPSDVLEVGQKVQVKILGIDEEHGRISLSMKAVTPSPWEIIEETAAKGTELTGIVRRLVDFGAFVEVLPGVEGLVHISQISHEHVNHPSDKLKEGQEVQVKVLEVNAEDHRLSLSMKALEEAPEQQEEKAEAPRRERKAAPAPRRKAAQNTQAKAQSPAAEEESSFSFADLLGDKLKDFNFDDSED